MDRELIPHPETPASAVRFVSAGVQRLPGGLDLQYVVEGDASLLVIPAPAKPYRTDELWRSTCFELFIREGNQAYCEINLSPSGQWAAYRFQDYRGEAEDLDLDEPPRIWFSREPFGLLLTASITIGLRGNGPVGLSAVIGEKDGTISYWALAHPPGDPDFHHPACFALELPAETDILPSPRT
ncbi:MAG: hypothetical protein QOD42_1759 [Sphingomonadales bacterium]|nr:hypothetical protein [Sphingomonadales bacterium]